MNFFQSGPVSIFFCTVVQYRVPDLFYIESFLSGPAVSNYPDRFRINFKQRDRVSKLKLKCPVCPVSNSKCPACPVSNLKCLVRPVFDFLIIISGVAGN